MYKLIEYSSNYSQKNIPESLWFHAKDEVTILNADIANFKSFEYKARLLGNSCLGC